MEPKELELYLIILRTLEAGPFKNVAQVLRDEISSKSTLYRLDYLGNEHPTDLNNLLAKYPNINSQTLSRICSNLQKFVNKYLPPSVRGIDSFLGDGQFSLLRDEQTLRLENVQHSSNCLMSSKHYFPAYQDHSVNVVKHIQARRLRGPVSIRRTMPTEIYSKTILYSKLMGHLSSAYCVCFDQTGQYVFTGADDFLIKIWSARDGRLLKTLRGHDGQISDMSVNYENRLLASAGMDRIIRIWDLRTTKLVECLAAHSATVTSVKFAPYNRHLNDKSERTDRYLISTSNDGSVIIWGYHVDNFGFKKLKRFQERNRPGGQLSCSSFSTGGSFLACGSSDNYIHLYGFHPNLGPYWLNELDKHTDKVEGVQFCNNGFRFVSGSKDGTAIIWSFKDNNWRPLKLDMSTKLDSEASTSNPSVPNTPRPAVLIVQWSRDDRYVMTSIVDYSIKVWDSNTGKLVHTLREHKHDVFSIESHPTDPRIFISASHDGLMIIWDIERGKVLKKFYNSVEQMEGFESATHASIYDIKFSPDGSMIAATDSHGYLALYGMGSRDPYRKCPEQMFFNQDYRPLIRDARYFVMDEQTHVACHLMPKPELVDMNGNPHRAEYQALVIDFKDRHVIPPLTKSQLEGITELIENHSIAEDEEFLYEKRSPHETSGRIGPMSNDFLHVNDDADSNESQRFNARYSTRSSFRSARVNFQPLTRRARQRVSYREGDEEEDNAPVREDPGRSRHRGRHQPGPRPPPIVVPVEANDSSTEEDVDDESETEIETDYESTEIDSDATEIASPISTAPYNTRQRRTQNSHDGPIRRSSARLRDRKRVRRN